MVTTDESALTIEGLVNYKAELSHEVESLINALFILQNTISDEIDLTVKCQTSNPFGNISNASQQIRIELSSISRIVNDKLSKTNAKLENVKRKLDELELHLK